MGLSFFKALNPVSRSSGIKYLIAGELTLTGTEMQDRTVLEEIRGSWYQQLNAFEGIGATYNILMGNHYDRWVKGHGSKGVLDYLIFPLLARKLIADCYLPERQNMIFQNIAAFTFAIPLEVIRFSAGVALTLLLVPIIAIIHLIKAFLPRQSLVITIPELPKLAPVDYSRILSVELQRVKPLELDLSSFVSDISTMTYQDYLDYLARQNARDAEHEADLQRVSDDDKGLNYSEFLVRERERIQASHADATRLLNDSTPPMDLVSSSLFVNTSTPPVSPIIPSGEDSPVSIRSAHPW